MRRLWLMALLLSVGVEPAHAAPPAVAGITIVSGPANSALKVKIPADTSLPLEDLGVPIDIEVSSGRFGGVFLHRFCDTSPGGLCDQALFLTPLGSLACAVEPCRPMQYQSVICYCEDEPRESVPLRAGTYGVVLTGEAGTNVTATLPFGGLNGSADLATSSPAGIEYEILDDGVTVAGERRHTFDSASRDISRRGYSYFFSPSADPPLVPGVTVKNTVQFICWDRPGEAPDAPVQCPGFEGNVVPHVVPGWPYNVSHGGMTAYAGLSAFLAHGGVCDVSLDCSAGVFRWSHRGIATGPPGFHNHVESLAIWTDWCGPFSCFDA